MPQLALTQEKMPFTTFLPSDTIVAVRDLAYVHDTMESIYQEGFSQQVVTERLEGATEVERAEIMEELRREPE